MLLSCLELSKHAVAAAGLGETRRMAAVATCSAAIRTQLSLRDAAEELAGRKAADVAFNLALAGCTDDELFAELCGRAEHELRRKTGRRAKSGVGLAQIAERFAAAGCRPEQVGAAGMYEAVLERLLQSGECTETTAALSCGNPRLHNPRAARWLHRRHHHHSLTAAQRRVAPNFGSLAKDGARLGSLFADESLDLCLDLGCGYGVGTLGFADAYTEGNVLGCDVNRASLCFGSGVAARWGSARAAHSSQTTRTPS